MRMQMFERAWKKVLLSVAESFLPRGYFVQGEPVYLTGEMVATEQLVPGYPKETQRFNQSLHGNIYAPMRDTNRWLLLRLMLDQVSSLPIGDYAELGTYQGASARIIYAHRAPETKLYCFDTFEGFSEKDIAIERTESGVMATAGDFANTSLNEVASFIGGKRGVTGLFLRQGYFPETFAGLEGVAWRFVHLDCDLYEPTKAGLDAFWTGLVSQGVMIVHDYNSNYRGVKKAVDEFCIRVRVSAIPWVDRCGSTIIVKP